MSHRRANIWGRWLLAALTGTCIAIATTVAFGEVKTIEVVGYPGLDHGSNIDFFDVPANPSPFRMTCEYDTTSPDLDPNPLHGLYENVDLRISLSFGEHFDSGGVGDYYFNEPNTEVQVWAGKDGFWGITFGNRDEFEAYALIAEPYAGLYGVFLQLYNLGNDDSLASVETLAGDSRLEFNYCLVRGEVAADEDERIVRYQQTSNLTYSVSSGYASPVPEPTANALALVALLWPIARRWR